MFFTDRLEHFDRDNLVVLAFFVAVIAQNDFGSVAKPLHQKAFACKGVLFIGQGQTGDIATILARCKFGKAAPAASHFQYIFT